MPNPPRYPHASAARSYARLALLLTLAWTVLPQGVDAQRGCDQNPLQYAGQAAGCLICPPTDSIHGTTADFTPTQLLNNLWCGTIENDQFFVAFADAGGRLSFEFTTDPACRAGLQYAVYRGDALDNLVPCGQHLSAPGQTLFFSRSGLTPGERLLIRIDGSAGVTCDFELRFLRRGTGGYPVYRVSYPAGANASDVDLAEPSCITCAYDATYAVSPAGAGTVTAQNFPTASPPHRELRAAWGAPAPERATVEETAVLSGTGNDPACAPSTRREVLSHFLDQSYVYLARDTVFDCSGDRHTFLLAPGATRRILFLENAAQRYVVAGAGAAGVYLHYRFRQNNVNLRQGNLTPARFTDTVRVDSKFGATVLTVTNPNDYPTELLVQRSAGSGLPYSFVQDCPSTSYQVCGGQPVFEFACGVRDPLATTDWPDDCGGIIDVRDARLETQTGEIVAGVQVSGRPTAWAVAWRLQFNRFSPPVPGNYVVRGVATVPQGCASLGCVSAAAARFEIPLTISAPTDTVRLPDVTLPAGGGAATLFAGISGLETLAVERPGEYVQAFNCVLYLQRALAAPAIVELGVQLICPGECLTAPTGETFGCVPGTASLLASNDTVYVANVRYDATEPLVLRAVDQSCDSLTGEWTARLRWTGSRGPWFVDGVRVEEPSVLVGPTRERVRELRVVGSSPCVDTVTFRVESSCRPSSLTEAARLLGIELLSNPASELQVRIASGRWSVAVLDALGRRVLAGDAEPGVQSWPASAALPAGTYLVDFRQNDRRAAVLWVKPE